MEEVARYAALRKGRVVASERWLTNFDIIHAKFVDFVKEERGWSSLRAYCDRRKRTRYGSKFLFHQSHFDWAKRQVHRKASLNRMQQKCACVGPGFHSAMADAKSIASPTRCLTSFSQALGLPP